MAWIMQQTAGAVGGGLVELAQSGVSQKQHAFLLAGIAQRDSSASLLPEFPLAVITLSRVA
jgi:hypothetical protein